MPGKAMSIACGRGSLCDSSSIGQAQFARLLPENAHVARNVAGSRKIAKALVEHLNRTRGLSRAITFEVLVLISRPFLSPV
jgi:hypothetical protein